MVITSSVEDKTAPPSRMVQSETWIPSSLLRKNKSQYKHTLTKLHHLKSCKRLLSSYTSITSWRAAGYGLMPPVMTLLFIFVGGVEKATLRTTFCFLPSKGGDFGSVRTFSLILNFSGRLRVKTWFVKLEVGIGFS